jgi:hypothetical protein
MGASFDTLSYVKRLTAAGVSREAAEVQAEMYRDELAFRVATKADLDALGARTKSSNDTLGGRIDALAVSTKSDIDRLDTKLEAKFNVLESRLIQLNWMVGFMLATTVAVLWKLIKLT